MRTTVMTDQHLNFKNGTFSVYDFGMTRRVRITQLFQGEEIIAQLDLSHDEILEVIIALGEH